MAWKKDQEDRKKTLKEHYKRVKNNQAKLELNYYVQKKMMEYPKNYMKEIKEDIQAFLNNKKINF